MVNTADGRVGIVEARGITPVPDERRRGSPSALFWMWFATNMGILSVTVGAVLVSLDGLNLLQVLAATLIGVGGSFLLVAALSLIVAFVGMICGADLTLYSSGLSLMAAGLKVKRPVAVLIDAVLIAAGGLYITIGANDFINPFTAFLTALAVPLMAWAGTFAVDMVSRRGFDHDALLHRSAGSRYWYTGGVQLPAVVSWLAGIIAGASLTTLPLSSHLTITGPFASSWLGRNNLGWLLAGLGSGIVYLCLGRVAVRVAEPVTSVKSG